MHLYPGDGGGQLEISNGVKHEEVHQAGESFISDFTAKEPGNVMDPASYEKGITTQDLQFNSDQWKELQDKFNRPNETDQNPNGATCKNCETKEPK